VTLEAGNRNHESLPFIEQLIDREKVIIEAHQNNAASMEDPKLRSLFTKLAEIHAQSLAELQSYLSESRSHDEITEQINEIFL
jgi:hypothetical protein